MHMTSRNLGDILGGADPDKAAIIDCREWHAPRTLRYRELEETVNALARGLLARGLQRGERVAILAANRYEFVAAYLGAMRAGLVAVPVNHKFPAAMLESVLADCAPRLVLVDAERRAAVPAGTPAIEFGTPEWDALQDPGPFSAVTPKPREAAMVLY